MSLQILDVQRDIQDVLDAVRNPAGKRKRASSDTLHPVDAPPTSPTTRRPTTQKPRDASPVHSLMHSRHATTAAQEVLDALALRSSPSPVTQTQTEATNPSPTTTAEPNTPPTDVSTAAPDATTEWKIVKGKRAKRKSKGTGSGLQRTAEPRDKTPTKQNGARGKKPHQPIAKHHRGSKSWADVVRSGGINVQIVLGNGNLGQTTPVRLTGKRGERRGGTAGRERQRGIGGRGDRRERGPGGRGNAGPGLDTCGGALGESMEVDGEGGKKDKGVPGAASPERIGPGDRTAGGSG
jgi:hypothetical protein